MISNEDYKIYMVKVLNILEVITPFPSSILFFISLKRYTVIHIRDSNLLFSHQQGFMPDRYFMGYMLCPMDCMMQAFDHGTVSHAIFIDISKATDRIPHTSPLYKAESCDIVKSLVVFL